MAYDKKAGKMKPSPNAKGPALGPNGSFKAQDPRHERLAISGATRSYNAGHISKGTEESIQSKARAMLGSSKSKGKSASKPVPRRKSPAAGRKR